MRSFKKKIVEKYIRGKIQFFFSQDFQSFSFVRLLRWRLVRFRCILFEKINTAGVQKKNKPSPYFGAKLLFAWLSHHNHHNRRSRPRLLPLPHSPRIDKIKFCGK